MFSESQNIPIASRSRSTERQDRPPSLPEQIQQDTERLHTTTKQRLDRLQNYFSEPEGSNPVEHPNLIQADPLPRAFEKIQNASIREVFEQFQIKGTETPLRDNVLFSSIVVLQNKTPSSEPLVRVYRGVQKTNAGLVQHIPYAMRSEDGRGGAAIIKEAKEAVDQLAKEPSYQNFLEYIRVMQPHWNQHEQARMATKIRALEDGVLSGFSLVDELFHAQIQHNGGNMTGGISPYVSATTDIKEALGYAGKGGNLVVMDVPLSKIGAFQSVGEVNLLGSMDDTYVTAILPRKNETHEISEEELQTNIHQAVSCLDKIAPVASDKSSEWHKNFKVSEVSHQAQEERQWSQDAALIRTKRANEIIRAFPSAGLNLELLRQKTEINGTDIYTESLREAFDHYLDRFAKIGGTRRPRDIGEYDYKSASGETRVYKRSEADESMLIALRKLVGYLEELYG